MPGVYVGVGCSFVKANKVFVGVGCSFVEATKVYTAENCNWKVIHEAGGNGLRLLVGPGGTNGIDHVRFSGYRSIVALSDDTVAFAVNESEAGSTTLIKIDSKGDSQWQRQSDRTQASVTWVRKHTNSLIKDSNDNIYQLGNAIQPSPSFKGVEWIEKFSTDGDYAWDRTTAKHSLLSGFSAGNPGTNDVFHAVFNGPEGDEESSLQIEGQSVHSFGSGAQEFMTGVSTYDTSDGSLDSFRVMGSSGGTGNNNGNNFGREICRLGDKIYSASQAPGHKCSSVNGPCHHVQNIYRRSLDGQTVDNNGGGKQEVNSTSFPLFGDGCAFTNGDEDYDFPILFTFYKRSGLTPFKNYFWFYDKDLTLASPKRFELTGPASGADTARVTGNAVVWDASDNHIYTVFGNEDLNQFTIIKFDVATGTIQNQNRFRITNTNDRLMIENSRPCALTMTSDKFYIQSSTTRFDDTGVDKNAQVIVLQIPKDLTKGFGSYGDNLVYEERPTDDLYTMASSTDNPNYSGPGGSFYWPIPTTTTFGTQNEDTDPTADNIVIEKTKQKN